MSRQSIITAVISLTVGLGIGYTVWSTDNSAPITTTSTGQEIDYWAAPMDPNYRRDKPGKSPMGMDLIPVYKGEQGGKSDIGFTVSPNVLVSLGVKTTAVKFEQFSPTIKATGQTTYDERLVSQVQIRSDGWVEALHVKALGDSIKKGDLLFTYYSPEIANVLSEFMQIKASGSKHLKKVAASRLDSFGLGGQAIAHAMKSKDPHKPISVFANQNGYVTKLGIREGSRISKNTLAFEITDTSNMWVVAEVFASKAKIINVGQKVILSNGETSVVDYIYPDVDAKLQNVRVRLNLSNPMGMIKAGEYVALTIEPKGHKALLIPDTAVIRLGDSTRVILAHGDGKFEAAAVTLGASDKGETVILQGLAEGEKIVTSGQFMLDSESSFTGASLRLIEKEATKETTGEAEAFTVDNKMENM